MVNDFWFAANLKQTGKTKLAVFNAGGSMLQRVIEASENRRTIFTRQDINLIGAVGTGSK